MGIRTFQDLAEEGVLSPARNRLRIVPRVSVPSVANADGRWTASGYVTILGYLIGHPVVVYSSETESDKALDAALELRAFLDGVRRDIVDFLEERHPNLRVSLEKARLVTETGVTLASEPDV